MTAYQLHIGDCAEVMREQIADGAIDLTVTSPPYDNLRKYNGYHFDFEAIAAELWRVTKPGGVVVWVVGDETSDFHESLNSFNQTVYFVGLGFGLLDTMIYHKKNYAPAYPGLRRYANVFEYMFVFSKGRPATFNPIQHPKSEATIKRLKPGAAPVGFTRQNGAISRRVIVDNGKATKDASNLWSYGVGRDKLGHPAPFPEALARDHIISWSNPGDVVLDPMCGSGTTGKQAVLLGRHFIGIDISAEYIDGIARPRIEQAVSQARQLSLLEQGGLVVE